MKIRGARFRRLEVLGMVLVGGLVVGGCAGTQANTAVDSAPGEEAGAAADQVPDGGEAPAVSAQENGGGADSFTVLGHGDILIHNSLWMQAESDGGGTMDFEPMLAGVKSRISAADLAICHLETPLAPEGGPYGSYPVFSTPPQVVKAIKSVGYDGCSTVSNHTLDQGFAGVKRTLDFLDRARLGHAGSARSEAESKKFQIYDVKGVKVAHLAYATNFNGYSVPSGQPWCCNKLSASKIIADARAARDGGAQTVIVSMHAGDENTARPSTEQRDIARAVGESGTVDLILGNHVHVVQPVEKIGKMWVAYGHGNLISGQYESWHRNREGVTTVFTFSRQSDGSYAITQATGYPVFDADKPNRTVDLVTALPRSGGDSRQLEAYRETRKTLLSLGAGRDGFEVPEPGQRS